MRIPPELVPGVAEENRGFLVLGYQGTLAPDPESRLDPAGAEEIAVREFPLEPWIARALRDLSARRSAASAECRGTCIDPNALTETLRERLIGILTPAQAACPDAGEEALARSFPALPALLAAAAAEWVQGIAVFHERWHRDSPRLAQWLGYATLPDLAAVTSARSDSHEGGHAVLRVTFQDGRCLYYKPRPVTGEWLWDGLVRAVNEHSSLQLDAPPSLQGANGRYGWVASVAPQPGTTEWDRDAYWQAAGATLCLAAQVRMTDLHLANLIATARGPVPIDAESFGAPRMAAEMPLSDGADPVIVATMANLLDTGLLPIRQQRGLPDVSGLFGKAAPVPGILVPRWSRAAGGALRLQRSPAVLLDQGNALPGASPLAALPQLVSGYREAGEALLRCRESLTASRSPWRQILEGHAPRIVVRDTLAYGLLVSQSLHPELLRSAHRRRIALQGALRSTLPAALRRAELHSLLDLHIPRFTALPGSRTLAGASGRRLAPRFLACSPAEAVLRGITALSAQSLADAHVPALQLALLSQV